MTPGPWKLDRNWFITGSGNDWDKHWMAPGIELDNFDKTKDQRVCQVVGPSDNAVEDSRLIAAAPELLQALKFMMTCYSDEYDVYSSGYGKGAKGDVLLMAEAAIRKAEGK